MKQDSLPTASNLTEGSILPGAIDNIAKEFGLEFCDVTGFGEVDWLEVKEPGDDGTIHRFSGPLVITDLKGRIRAIGGMVFTEYFCTAARHTDNGVQMLGGRLVGARTRFVELQFQPLVMPGEGVENSSGDSRQLAQAPARRETSSTGSSSNELGKGAKWEKVIAESKQLERNGSASAWDDDEDDFKPSAGDIVNHRQFGKCVVVKLDDDHIALRKPDGRVVQLGLTILRFSLQGEDDGISVYDVHVKRQ